MWIWGVLNETDTAANVLMDYYNYVEINSSLDIAQGKSGVVQIDDKDVEYRQAEDGVKYVMVLLEEGKFFVSPEIPPAPYFPEDPLATLSHGQNVVGIDDFIELLEEMKEGAINGKITAES